MDMKKKIGRRKGRWERIRPSKDEIIGRKKKNLEKETRKS